MAAEASYQLMNALWSEETEVKKKMLMPLMPMLMLMRSVAIKI